MTADILVLDGEKNCSLVVTRSLNDKGVSVTTGSWSRVAPSLLSKHGDRTYLYPNPYTQPEQFVSELVEYLSETDHLAVIPMSDLTHTLLSKHKPELEATGTTVGTEDWETFRTANNKKAVAELATELSIPTPSTHAPTSIAEVRELRDQLSYPVLLKPRSTTVEVDGEYTEARISEENYVYAASELVSRYKSLISSYPYLEDSFPLIQTVVSGEVVATCGVAEEGDLVAAFQEERLRMYPVDGGSSALRRGIDEPEMQECAERLVDALEWTGPIYVEFLRTDDEECHLLEINGRYWGSVGCSVAGGVDVPYAHYRLLVGESPDQETTYRTGVHQRRLFYTDIRWLCAHLSDGQVGALVPFCASFTNADHDILDWTDPLPTAGAMLWGSKELLKKLSPL